MTMYVKKKKELTLTEQAERFLDAIDTIEMLEDDNNAREQELPLYIDTHLKSCKDFLPYFQIIADHGSETITGYCSVTIDGVRINAAASSTCHPSDEYDEWTGHALTLARLTKGLSEALEEAILARAEVQNRNLKKSDLHI